MGKSSFISMQGSRDFHERVFCRKPAHSKHGAGGFVRSPPWQEAAVGLYIGLNVASVGTAAVQSLAVHATQHVKFLEGVVGEVLFGYINVV